MRLVRKIKEKYQIVAVHFRDLYPKGFQAFFDKYKTVKDYDIWVNFSNHADNTIDKTAFSKPDHADPVGVYVYPLSYVIKHPSDIWYGRNAKFLRIIRSKAKKPLYLNSVDSERKADDILMKMGIDNGSHLMDLAWKHYKNRIGKNKNTIAKKFFTVVQLDLEQAEKDEYNGKIKHKLRTGVEQTALLKKAGYDAIFEDSRNNKQAIVNEREPQQAFFLSRSAFEVVEVFNLRIGKKDRRGLTTISPDDLGMSPKLAALIAEYSQDNIIKRNERKTAFWTKQGRRIEIEWVLPDSYYKTRKMGEKKHKEVKTYDLYMPRVTIYSEHGKTIYLGDENEKLKDVAIGVLNQMRSKEKDPNWQPETKESYEQAVKDANDERIRTKIDEEKAEDLEEVPDHNKSVAYLASKTGLPFEPPSDPEDGYWLYKCLNSFAYYLRGEIGAAKKRRENPLPLEAAEFDSAWNLYQQVEEERQEVALVRKEKADKIMSQLSQVKDILKKMYTTYSDDGLLRLRGGGLFNRPTLNFFWLKRIFNEEGQ